MSSTGSKCCEKCISIKYPRGDAEYVCTVPYCPCHSPLDTYRKAPELLNVDPWARRDKNCKRVPAMKSGYCRPEVDLNLKKFILNKYFNGDELLGPHVEREIERAKIRMEIRKEMFTGLLALLAILAIGVFLIAL